MNGYRYGFNGQEHSTEIGDDDYTAQFWEYDSRIGRRWNIDPKPKMNVSGYSTFSNNPIFIGDPNGASGVPSTSGNKAIMTATFNFVNNGLSPAEYAQAKTDFMNNVTGFFNETRTYNGMAIGNNFTQNDYKGTIDDAHAETFQAGINYIVLSHSGGSKASSKGGNLAFINTNDLAQGNNTAFHEVAHLFGLSDRYAYLNSFYTNYREGGSIALKRRGEKGYAGAIDIPVAVPPDLDKQYLNQENNNVMFDGYQNGVTQYQWSIMFTVDKNGSQNIERDWGGNNVYIGQFGTGVGAGSRHGFDWKGNNLGGIVLGVSRIGNEYQVGYWNILGGITTNWVQLWGVQGWINKISLGTDPDFGKEVLKNPVTDNKTIVQNIDNSLRTARGRQGE